MDKEELKRATSRMNPKRVTELPPIIRRDAKSIIEAGDEKPDVRKSLSRRPIKSKKGGRENEMKQTANNLLSKKEQSDWLRDRKSGSIELKGRKNQEKKIVIDTQSDPEDQPQVQTKARKGYFSIVLVIAVILLVILVGFLIGYVIYLQGKNIDYIEKNSVLETELLNCDEAKAECKEQENIYNDRLDNITHILTNCSSTLLACSNFSDNSCIELKSNYTDIFNKYILLTVKNNETKTELQEIKNNYDELQTNYSLLQQKYDSLKANNSATNECNEVKNEQIENSIRMQEIGNENIYLMEENDNKLTTIKFLKEENINLYSKYMNLKIVYEIGFHESKLDQIEKKYFIQNMQETLQIQRHKTNSLIMK